MTAKSSLGTNMTHLKAYIYLLRIFLVRRCAKEASQHTLFAPGNMLFFLSSKSSDIRRIHLPAARCSHGCSDDHTLSWSSISNSTNGGFFVRLCQRTIPIAFEAGMRTEIPLCLHSCFKCDWNCPTTQSYKKTFFD
jgi:hypothetical protein